MPAAIGARLVQSAEYDVVELGQGLRPFAEPGGDGATAVPREVASWLARGVADEIITGAAGMLQTSVVVTAQRYGLRGGEPALIGAAAIAAPRVTDVMSLVDSLVEDLFSAEAEIIVRPIEQLFIIPSTLRLPMGRQGQLQAFAVDAMGRPVSKVEYLFQSSDTALLEVDENGRVTGIAPGQAVVTVRAVGRPTRWDRPPRPCRWCRLPLA